MTKSKLTLKFPATDFIDAADLAHFLFLFRGAYASCADTLKTVKAVDRIDDNFKKIAKETLRALNASDIDQLFSRELGSKSLIVQRISFESPLEIALAGVPALLCIAVILSGGKFKWGNLHVLLPPIGVGIKNLREALTPTIKAPIEYGIRLPQIKLSPDEFQELMKQDPKTKKDGGFQGFLVRLQQKVNRNNHIISLSESDINKIIHFGRDSRRGGWQARVKKIFGRHFDL